MQCKAVSPWVHRAWHGMGSSHRPRATAKQVTLHSVSTPQSTEHLGAPPSSITKLTQHPMARTSPGMVQKHIQSKPRSLFHPFLARADMHSICYSGTAKHTCGGVRATAKKKPSTPCMHPLPLLPRWACSGKSSQSTPDARFKLYRELYKVAKAVPSLSETRPTWGILRPSIL